MNDTGRFAAIAALLAASLAGACDTEEAPRFDPIPITPGACGRGLVVVSSDYASTSVSILGFDGKAIARDFLGSGSATPGLSAALSGDVVVPTGPTDRVMIVDRASSVLTWFDTDTGALDQLSVGTGFTSNPYDVLSIGVDKAYVARFARNASPGREAFDTGSDILIVSGPGGPILGRIDLDGALAAEDASLEASPTRLLRRGDQALALLAVLGGPQFQMAGQARLAIIDVATDIVSRVTEITGARNCTGMALSPSGRYVGVSCSGAIVELVPTVDESFVVVLDAEADFAEVGRLAAADFDQAFTFSIAFASEEHLLVPTFGSKEPPESDDRLIDFAWRARTASVVHQSAAITLGEVRCICDTCYVADASSDALLMFGSDETGLLGPRGRSEPVTRLGLPPRAIGAF